MVNIFQRLWSSRSRLAGIHLSDAPRSIRMTRNIAVLLEPTEEGVVPQLDETTHRILQVGEVALDRTRRDKRYVIVTVMAGFWSGSPAGGG